LPSETNQSVAFLQFGSERKMNVIENPSPDFERQFVQTINARRKLKGVCLSFHPEQSSPVVPNLEQAEVCDHFQSSHLFQRR
jgi:hypothetical protein